MSTSRSSGHYCHPRPSLETCLSHLSSPGIVYLVKGIILELAFSQWTKQNSRQCGLLINLPDSLLLQVQKYSSMEKSLEYKILSLPVHLHCVRCSENLAAANGTNQKHRRSTSIPHLSFEALGIHLLGWSQRWCESSWEPSIHLEVLGKTFRRKDPKKEILNSITCESYFFVFASPAHLIHLKTPCIRWDF